MKCSYNYMGVDMYELSLHDWSPSPATIKGIIQTYPLLFTSSKTQWFYIVGIDPRCYFDVSADNSYLGPLSCMYSNEGWYEDAINMNLDVAYQIIVLQTCYYLGIIKQDLKIRNSIEE